ncbi:GTP-binding protein lepa [Meredithblackwellia eburnea MCA 4105]
MGMTSEAYSTALRCITNPIKHLNTPRPRLRAPPASLSSWSRKLSSTSTTKARWSNTCSCNCSKTTLRRSFSTSRRLAQEAVRNTRPQQQLIDLSQFPPSKIRNLIICAHIDHGKSTLADRLLELTGTIPPMQISSDRNEKDVKNEQVLDTLKVERERGITVRAQSASMVYKDDLGESFLINLLDTPGHVDFSSELLRSMLPSQGALLLVDAAQGIQAQTLTVLEEARNRGLKIMGAVNKWDLVQHDGRGEAAVAEVADLIDCKEDEVLRVSAKTGMGVESVLEGIVARIPPPQEAVAPEKLRALVFDSWYDSFRGVVSLVAIVEGEIRKGDSITSTTTKTAYTVVDLGIMSPKELSIAAHPIPASRVLRKGMIGWIVCGMKDVNDAFLGDTFHHTHSPMPPLESFKPLKSMVFAGIYPLEPGGFPKLEDAVRRLTLTDRSVTSNRESSSFLGQGFRLGFNGSLHMDVFRQRLEDEYDEEVIVTRPLVPVRLIYKNGEERTIDNPADFPDPGGLLKVAKIEEPMIRATIVAPDEYTGDIINLCTSHRGVPISHTYLASSKTLSTSHSRITLIYLLPLSSIVTNFHSTLKSLTSGFASFDYEEAPYEESDLVRMNILVNGVKVDALCSVMHRSQVEKEGREWARRLREVVPRQQYEVVIQAAVGSTIVARERVAPVCKDVTAGLYGGDYTRKMKHLAKQKAGKKRLKERSIGNVTIPTSAFFTVLGGKEGQRKGGPTS